MTSLFFAFTLCFASDLGVNIYLWRILNWDAMDFVVDKARKGIGCNGVRIPSIPDSGLYVIG